MGGEDLVVGKHDEGSNDAHDEEVESHAAIEDVVETGTADDLPEEGEVGGDTHLSLIHI